MSNDDIDILKKSRDYLIGLITKAKKEALTRGIKANSIFINTNMVEVPETWVHDGCQLVGLPPMICGLNAYFTKDELPEGYTFAVVEGVERKARLEEFESIGMEPAELKKAAKLYRSIMDQLGGE